MAETTLPRPSAADPGPASSGAQPLPVVDEFRLPAVARTVRWAGLLFVVCAAVLVPWTAYLAVTLPDRKVAVNYNLSWAGFDAILLVGIVWTAFSALHCSRWLGTASSATAALLLVDAWTDVVTSTTVTDRLVALAMAVVVELPLLAVCGWLAVHATDIVERRLLLLVQLGADGGTRRRA